MRSTRIGVLASTGERIGYVASVATIAKTLVDIFVALDERKQKRAGLEKRIADLEAEIQLLREAK